MGKRGPKKGAKYKPTITKEQAREALRQIVLREMGSLVAAQIANARGLSFLVVRDKRTGKLIRVGESRTQVKLGNNEEVVEVWEKDPCVQAFTDLMNRALDKPSEHVQLSGNITAKMAPVHHHYLGIIDKRAEMKPVEAQGESKPVVAVLPPVKEKGE